MADAELCDYSDTNYLEYVDGEDDDYAFRAKNRKKSQTCSNSRNNNDQSDCNQIDTDEDKSAGYGRTFSHLYDRAWNLIKTAFRKGKQLID